MIIDHDHTHHGQTTRVGRVEIPHMLDPKNEAFE